MNKILIYLFMLFLVSTLLYSQAPLIKFYLKDGNVMNYKIEEIDNMTFEGDSSDLFMEVYYNDRNIRYSVYPLVKMEFGLDSITGDITLILYGKYMSSTFTSLDSIIFGYKQRATICSQIWTENNLNVSNYRNGDEIFHAKSKKEWEYAAQNNIGAWCYYQDDSTLVAVYGKLYNWYAVNDPRGLAPEGWHIPTDEEWKELEICLGMTKEDAELWGYRGNAVGAKLAGISKLAKLQLKGWQIGELSNHSEFDSSGFKGIPAGYRRYNGEFYDATTFAYWWSSSQYSNSNAIYRSLIYASTRVIRHNSIKGNGFSVRCIKD